ncbi:MAG: hypothetical protein Q9161_008856 [Pseudevernia consocians]
MAHNRVKLDTDLYPIYESYKKATNAIVRWIATAASGSGMGPDDTKWRAESSTKSKPTDIPPRIPCAFQDAIEARKEIIGKQHTKIDSVKTKKYKKLTETYAEGDLQYSLRLNISDDERPDLYG